MKSDNHKTPYENLDPNLILNAIESVGFMCSGSLLALNSYENRVYQVGLEEGAPLIVKFYRPGRWSDDSILEEHQFALELMEQEIPVVAPCINAKKETLHHYQGYSFALFPRWGGRALELDRLDQLEWMGRFIGRVHAVSACRAFKHRPRLDAQTYGYAPYQFLMENNFLPPELKTHYRQIVDSVLQKVGTCFEKVGDIKYIRLHGDMHAGNVLWDDAGPHIVDLDDCMMGPAIQDIWMLLPGDAHDIRIQRDAILRGYQEFHDFNYREVHLMTALRTLRMINYSAWIARRWEDPTFPQNFPWFNTLNYWKEQCLNLQEQSELLDE